MVLRWHLFVKGHRSLVVDRFYRCIYTKRDKVITTESVKQAYYL